MIRRTIRGGRASGRASESRLIFAAAPPKA